MEKIKQAIKKYCAIEERCQKQVFEKAIAKGMSETQAKAFLAELIAEKYIDNRRFATIFAKSKLHQNQWGPKKIAWELSQRGIALSEITQALAEIPNEEFLETAKALAEKKKRLLKTDSAWEQKQKIWQFLSDKGYTAEMLSKLSSQTD